MTWQRYAGSAAIIVALGAATWFQYDAWGNRTKAKPKVVKPTTPPKPKATTTNPPITPPTPILTPPKPNPVVTPPAPKKNTNHTAYIRSINTPDEDSGWPIVIEGAAFQLFNTDYLDDKQKISVRPKIHSKTYDLHIPSSEYRLYKDLDHSIDDDIDMVSFVTHTDKDIQDISKKITAHLSTNEQKAQQILDYVHTNVYDTNRASRNDNHYKFPLETIVEKSGVCRDFATLDAAMTKSLGLDVILIDFPDVKIDGGKRISHLGVGIAGNFTGDYFTVDGKKYFYAETTGTKNFQNPSNWKIGQLPSTLDNKLVNIYVVK